MTDREKVIMGLEELRAWLKHLQAVGFHGDIQEYRERELTVSDAIALLKEQETIDAAIEPCKSCQEWDCHNCEWLKVVERR